MYVKNEKKKNDIYKESRCACKTRPKYVYPLQDLFSPWKNSIYVVHYTWLNQ